MFSGQRLRRSAGVRALLSETRLHPSQFIMPIFVHEGITSPKEIPSMPGIFQLPLDAVLAEVSQIQKLGILAVILFGIPMSKDALGTRAKDAHGGVQRAISMIKTACPEMVVIADCCLCEYTDHGHCSVFRSDGEVDQPGTLAQLSEIAISYAQAGADIIAPSGMMDGMVAAIRQGLDDHGFGHRLILSYSAKYASALYGPFRDAGGTSLGEIPTLFSNRSHHQMNPGQRSEAIQESLQDIDEGADMLMVKPAGFYLDIISELKSTTLLPVAAYQVSGEYAMIKAAAANGWLDETAVVKESLIAIKRAGADLIITYFAKQISERL